MLKEPLPAAWRKFIRNTEEFQTVWNEFIRTFCPHADTLFGQSVVIVGSKSVSDTNTVKTTGSF